MNVGESEEEDWEDEEWDDDESTTPKPVRWWGWVAFLLSLAGFGDSLYLTVEHFSGGMLNCPETGIISCFKVTQSPQSEVFGVFPVALLGLLFFTALVAINVPALWQLDGRNGRLLAYGRLALVVTGIGMVIYLIYTELFTIKAICLYCTGVHVVTFLIFVLVVVTFPTMASLGVVEPDV